MNNHFKKLFHLQEVVVTGTKIEGKYLVINCKPRTNSVICKNCQKRITTVHRYFKPRKIKHMFWQGNLILLNLSIRSFACRSCYKNNMPHTTIERLSFIPKNKRYSLVYADQIIKGLESTSFKTQSQISESSFSTIQKILTERIDPFVGRWHDEEVTIAIGLDCHSFSGIKMLPTVTDITNHRLITILPDSKAETVNQFLNNIPDKKKKQIKEVCIDMDTSYLKVIYQKLPQTQIVVDFFHVVADAGRRINEERANIQRTDKVKLPKMLFEKPKEKLNPNQRVALNEIIKAYPELGELWRVKEEIRRIHKTPSKHLASIFYGSLLKKMKVSDYKSIKSWAKTLSRWQDGILQYFDHYTTNGYTEGVNTKLKTIKRLSYGFRNIDNYIRKAMLAFIPISLLLTHYLT